MKPRLEPRQAQARYISYMVGFVLSIFATVLAYLLVVNNVWPMQTLIYVVLGIAVLQLIVQVVFFLHIGRGNHWRFVSFIFTIMVILILVVGTLWIMHNLNYNMMRMTPEQMQLYMQQNEGI